MDRTSIFSIDIAKEMQETKERRKIWCKRVEKSAIQDNSKSSIASVPVFSVVIRDSCRPEEEYQPGVDACDAGRALRIFARAQSIC